MRQGGSLSDGQKNSQFLSNEVEKYLNKYMTVSETLSKCNLMLVHYGKHNLYLEDFQTCYIKNRLEELVQSHRITRIKFYPTKIIIERHYVKCIIMIFIFTMN